MKKSMAASEDGATAIEFALLVIPYVFLMIGIIELSVMFAGATLLESATNAATRLIRTGQLQQGGGNQEAVFREELCDRSKALLDCEDMTVEAIPLTSFTDFDDFVPRYNADGALVPQGFDAGGSNDRVLVRTSYIYTMMTPFIGQLLAGNTRGEIQFISTLVLQIEPYDFEN